MSMRPKTKRRLLALVVGTIVVVGGLALLYQHRMSVAAAEIMQYRTDGMAAYQAGDYKTAITDLNVYVTKRKEDADALLAFGVSRSKVPTLDGSYITQSISIIRKYLTLSPGDIETSHRLLEMEEPFSSYAGPALDLAKELLRADPKDLVALKAAARINTRTRHFEDALAACDQYIAINPTDLEMQHTDLYLMQAMGRTGQELRDRADAQAAKYPTDPRFLLVRAWGYIDSRSPDMTTDEVQKNDQAARDLLKEAAKADPPDTQFVTYLVDYLDRASEFGLSQNVLDTAMKKFTDPTLLTTLVERLWESDKYAEVVTRLQNLDPKDPSTDANMIAYKAMSLFNLNRKPEAIALAATLSDRAQSEPVAYCWSTAMNAEFQPNPTPKAQVAQYLDALAHDPSNPIVRFMLGDAYMREGENDLAREAWEQVENELPNWPQPQMEIARVLVAEGRGDDPEALTSSVRGYYTAASGYEQYQAVVTESTVMFARLQANPDPVATRRLLESVQDLQTKIPGEPYTLPIYVALLAQTGDRDKAIDVIKTAIGQADKNGQDLLLQLVDVSRVEKLGMEQQLYDAVEHQYGLTPQLAYAKAYNLMKDAHTADGLQLLQDAKSKGAGDPEQWDIVICEYLEAARDPSAASAWVALGDKYPTNLRVQTTILTHEQSAWANRDFIDRTINRLKDLTSEEAVGWKVARARWLLLSANVQVDAAAAVGLLSDVVKNSAGEYEPHALLAEAYEKLGNNASALDEWKAASDLAPDSPQILYNYVKSLHESGQADTAALYFDKFAALPNLPPDLALQAAVLIASQGDAARAEGLLNAYPNATDQVLHDATLAKVYRMEGRINEAVTVYFRLSAAPNLNVATIREASEFFGVQHDAAAAHKFLDRLDAMNLAPGRKELMLADWDERFGDPKVAEQEYNAAIQAAGDDPDPTAQEVGFYLRQNRMSDVQSTLTAALTRWPTNIELMNLKNVQAAMAYAPKDQDIAPLVRVVSHDPQSPAAIDTLQAIVEAATSDPATTLANLQGLLLKYPDYFPLYLLNVQQLQKANRLQDALDVANKAISQFPESPDAAHLCAVVYSRLGRWNEMLASAQQWRMRGADHASDADLMIAEADLHLNQPLDAQGRLQPYIPDAEANPDANEELLVAYATALTRSGGDSDAAKVLMPLAQKDAKWRYDWLKMEMPSDNFTNVAAHPDAVTASAWIEQIRPQLDSTSLRDEQLVADAYFSIGYRWNDSNAYAMAVNALKPFVSSGSISESALLDYASAADAAGDDADAEAAYRQVIAKDPNQAIAKNNLAEILAKKGDAASLKEAEGLARQAIALQPDASNTSSFYDSLARIQLQEGQMDDALTSFQEGYRVNNTDLDILIGLASVCTKTNRFDEASRYLTQVDSILQPDQKLGSDLQAELDAARSAVQKANQQQPAAVSHTDQTPAGR
jgi:Tfp pilus assembly protein PilF